MSASPDSSFRAPATRARAPEDMEPLNPPSEEPETSAAAQPLPPPPRIVCHRPGHHRLLGHLPLWVGLVWVGGFGLLLWALWLTVTAWIIAWFGVTVPGEVSAKLPKPKGARTGRIQFTYYIEKHEYTVEDTVDDATFDWVHVGTPVKVRALSGWPQHPQLLEPAGYSEKGSGVWVWFALLGNVGLMWLVRRSLHEPLKQRALVREGIATEGIVVGKEEIHGWRRSWVVQYSYRAPRHGVVDTAGWAAVPDREWQVLMAVGRNDFEAAQVGATVTVLYDPRQPSRSTIYPFANYEATPASGEPPSG
jgi:hypothetical protein